MSISPGIVDPPNLNRARILALVMRDHADWTEANFDRAWNGYLEFMQLNKMNSGITVSAPPEIDIVWHAHMLDSLNYTEDCARYFGYYLHHNPCIGDTDRSDEDEATLSLFRLTFGRDPGSVWEGLTTCAKPGGGCGSIHPNNAVATA